MLLRFLKRQRLRSTAPGLRKSGQKS